MKLHDLIPQETLDAALEGGFVNVTRHPSRDLRILNYTAAAQFAREWNEATLNCRGLIVDDNDEIVARPFPKFFNYTEVRIPNHALGSLPTVTEKMDGSLGVLYQAFGGPMVATRGSFASDQAVWASAWLEETFPEFRVPDGLTVLVEIIYPGNRIVVDYGDFEGLVLLAVIDNETGADVPLWEVDWWPGEKVQMHTGFKSIDEVHRFVNEHGRNQNEGVVMAWYRPGVPSFRLKIKGAEYVRLHKLITNCSSKTIWEALSRGDSLQSILDNVPDEFYAWVREVQDGLWDRYYTIYQAALNEFERIVAIVGEDIGGELIVPDASRKAFAAKAQKYDHPGLLFSLLDGKSISDTIWKLIKPAYERPFWSGVEEEV